MWIGASHRGEAVPEGYLLEIGKRTVFADAKGEGADELCLLETLSDGSIAGCG
jgi:hypothetical protein